MSKFSSGIIVPAVMVIAGAIGCIACSFAGNTDAASLCLGCGCVFGFFTAAMD